MHVPSAGVDGSRERRDGEPALSRRLTRFVGTQPANPACSPMRAANLPSERGGVLWRRSGRHSRGDVLRFGGQDVVAGCQRGGAAFRQPGVGSRCGRQRRVLFFKAAYAVNSQHRLRRLGTRRSTSARWPCVQTIALTAEDAPAPGLAAPPSGLRTTRCRRRMVIPVEHVPPPEPARAGRNPAAGMPIAPAGWRRLHRGVCVLAGASCQSTACFRVPPLTPS